MPRSRALPAPGDAAPSFEGRSMARPAASVSRTSGFRRGVPRARTGHSFCRHGSDRPAESAKVGDEGSGSTQRKHNPTPHRPAWPEERLNRRTRPGGPPHGQPEPTPSFAQPATPPTPPPAASAEGQSPPQPRAARDTRHRAHGQGQPKRLRRSGRADRPPGGDTGHGGRAHAVQPCRESGRAHTAGLGHPPLRAWRRPERFAVGTLRPPLLAGLTRRPGRV